MDERRLHAWRAMELGPVWRQRGPADRLGASAAGVLPMPTGPADAQPPVAASALVAAQEQPSIAGLDWTALQAMVRECRRCRLADTRTQTVFGVGPQPADWMLVGEAPGAEEDARGEPFVGQAGRLLDRMLAAIGLNRREHVFIANVLKCRPPRNRDPQPEEVAACEAYLLRQIELVAPRVILVLGRFAAQSLLSTEATIGSLRGRVHETVFGTRRIPVVVTYHPAYLLRNPADKARAWSDLCLARRLHLDRDKA